VEREEFEKIYWLEDTHWWFVGKRAVTSQLVGTFCALDDTALLLDVGCGTGGMLDLLRNFGSPVGIDISPIALDFCRQRGQQALAQGAALSLPFADNAFALITVSDLLYSQQPGDDGVALQEFHRVCQPGGHLLIIEPALEWLRGPHDVVYDGRHRYTTGELRDKVTAAGFRVVKVSYANTLLLPPILAVRAKHRLLPPARPSSDLKPLPSLLNRLSAVIYCWETSLLPRINLPVGSSVVCLACRL
jgi:SAM-dependent methyltransferase